MSLVSRRTANAEKTGFFARAWAGYAQGVPGRVWAGLAGTSGQKRVRIFGGDPLKGPQDTTPSKGPKTRPHQTNPVQRPRERPVR
jgi:hypothetical protein